MKKIAFLSFLFFNIQCIFSQDKIDYSKWPSEDQKIFERAMGLFEEKNYTIAYEGFSKLLASRPNELALKYLTGICGIYRSDKHVEAKSLLTEVYQKNKLASDMDYYFALLYHRLGEFDKSLQYATTLQKKKLNSDQKKTLAKLVEYCNNGKLLVQQPVDVHITNIGAPPNSEYAEYSPVVTADETTLIYTYRGKDSKGGLQNVFGKPDKYGFYYEDVFVLKNQGMPG